MEWWSIIRHSVDTKIMVRIPKAVFLTKAKQLQCEYLAECLKHNVIPEHVEVNHRWLNRLLATYRISHRRPNRKFKVPRAVLMQRLEIFWIVTAKLRTMVMVHFGYDPTFKNIDQSPFHQNEAGSQEWGTLALVGQHTVPLIENHAATRERWSLNTLTDSAEEQISDDNMPGFEIMFKAEGKQVEAKLQAYVLKKKILGMRVTVVTGPSGSYRENDILNFLEKHLPPWGPARRWEIFLLDAYAPGLTDNVQRFGWLRGYLIFTHGGGASMVCQTNDTDSINGRGSVSLTSRRLCC